MFFGKKNTIRPGVEFDGFLEYWRQQIVGISTGPMDVIFWQLSENIQV